MKVMWSAMLLEGGKRHDAPLPQPCSVAGPFQEIPYLSRTSTPTPSFYVDTHVLAFRAPADELDERAIAARVSTPPGPLNSSVLADGGISEIKKRNRRIELGLPVKGEGPDLSPFYKIGRHVMFPKRETDEWLLARRVVKARATAAYA